MNSRQISIIKPLLHTVLIFYFIDWNLFKTVIDFKFGCFKTFNIFFFGKIAQNVVGLFLLTASLWLASTKLKFDLLELSVMGRILLVTAGTSNNLCNYQVVH